MKLNWKRLIWVVFVCLYAALFFYNCLKPFGNWVVPYIYTMVLIVWLAYEYYRRNFFFQSGLIPDALYFWLPRALFALFFYSSFVIGIATIIWWPANRIGLYPAVNTIGLCILLGSIYLRWMTFKNKKVDKAVIRNFYVSIALLILSLAFGYGSIFLFGYAIVIGLPIIYWNYIHEIKALAGFSEFTKKQGESAKPADYTKLWEKYLASRTTKPKKNK